MAETTPKAADPDIPEIIIPPSPCHWPECRGSNGMCDERRQCLN